MAIERLEPPPLELIRRQADVEPLALPTPRDGLIADVLCLVLLVLAAGLTAVIFGAAALEAMPR